MENLHRILEICRRNGWSYETPNIAGIIENLLNAQGFTRRTKRDYVESAIHMLKFEKKLGIDLSTDSPLSGRKQSPAFKEAKGKRKVSEGDNTVIYSSPIPLNGVPKDSVRIVPSEMIPEGSIKTPRQLS